MTDRMSWRTGTGILLVTGLAIAGGVACGGGNSSSPTGSTTTTGAAQVGGTLTRAPGVSAAWERHPSGTLDRLLSRLTTPLVGTAEAALPPGDPLANVVVRLECAGQPAQTTRTSASGRFEFEGVPGGTTCSIFVVLNGVSVAVAIDIRVGAGPVEIEGRVSSVGGQPGLARFEVESEVDDDDGHGHHRHHKEHHQGQSGDDDHRKSS